VAFRHGQAPYPNLHHDYAAPLSLVDLPYPNQDYVYAEEVEGVPSYLVLAVRDLLAAVMLLELVSEEGDQFPATRIGGVIGRVQGMPHASVSELGTWETRCSQASPLLQG